MTNFNKPTNPPAFPSSVDDGETVKYMLGMNVRDYFAAKVMQGMEARHASGTYESRAASAYKQADAMLRAREA
jgi:hypothetical protein